MYLGFNNTIEEKDKVNYKNKLLLLVGLIDHLVHKNQELDKWLPEESTNVQMSKDEWIQFKEQQRRFKTISNRLVDDFKAATNNNRSKIYYDLQTKFVEQANEVKDIFQQEYDDLAQKIASLDEQFSAQFPEDISATQSPVDEKLLANAKTKLMNFVEDVFKDPSINENLDLITNEYIDLIKSINAINEEFEAWLRIESPNVEQWQTMLEKYQTIEGMKQKADKHQQHFNDNLSNQNNTKNLVNAHLKWDELNFFFKEAFNKLTPLSQQFKEQVVNVFGTFPSSFDPVTLESQRSLQTLNKFIESEAEVLAKYVDINTLVHTIQQQINQYIQEIAEFAKPESFWNRNLSDLKSYITANFTTLQELSKITANNPLDNTNILSDLEILINNLNNQVDKINELKRAAFDAESQHSTSSSSSDKDKEKEEAVPEPLDSESHHSTSSSSSNKDEEKEEAVPVPQNEPLDSESHHSTSSSSSNKDEEKEEAVPMPQNEPLDSESQHSTSTSDTGEGEKQISERISISTIINDFKTAKIASDLKSLKDKLDHPAFILQFGTTLEQAIKFFELTALLEEQLQKIKPEDKILQLHVTNLIENINNNVRLLMAKEIYNFNQPNVNECMDMIAKTIDLHRDKFEPAWWHSVADFFIEFFNGLKDLAKSLGANTTRTRLFSERTVEGVMFNRVMTQLQEDATGFKAGPQP